jgi:hypothetical protein
MDRDSFFNFPNSSHNRGGVLAFGTSNDTVGRIRARLPRLRTITIAMMTPRQTTSI